MAPRGWAMDPRDKPWDDGGGVAESRYLWWRTMVGRDAYIAVYIMSNRPYGTLYVGVTSALARRVWEHREGVYRGFTRTYGLKRLVWYEPHDEMTTAIQREKSIKRWPRDWKINLIERGNPRWEDLYPGLSWTYRGYLIPSWSR